MTNLPPSMAGVMTPQGLTLGDQASAQEAERRRRQQQHQQLQKDMQNQGLAPLTGFSDALQRP